MAIGQNGIGGVAAAKSDGTVRARRQKTLRWELLTQIIRKDLKVKYQGSVLGFLWSLANPLLLLMVYTFVFGVVLKSGIPHFGFYILSGLLIWNFFSGTVGTATQAVVGNAGLVQKVPFPLAVLPLATVGYHVVHLALQIAVLMVAQAVTGFTDFLDMSMLWMIPAFGVALILATGVAFLVAALNVRFRDTQHIVEVLLTAGFWVNPIVYAVVLIRQQMGGTFWEFLYWLNPMAGVTIAMQRALYAAPLTINGTSDLVLATMDVGFFIEKLAIGGGVSVLILILGVTVYQRMSADFAENL